MSAYDLVENLLRAAGRLLKGSMPNIVEEGVGSAIEARVERKQKKSMDRNSSGCLSILGAVAAVVIMGVVNSSETYRLLVEQFNGDKGAVDAFEHQTDVVIFWVGAVFIGFAVVKCTMTIFETFRAGPGHRFYKLFERGGFVVLMLMMLRFAYNKAWGTEAEQNGDILIVCLGAAIWITVIFGVPWYILDTEASIWRNLGRVFLAAVVGVIMFFCGWGAVVHIAGGNW